MSVAFTDRFLRSIGKPSPIGKAKQYWDAACPNLGVRVSGTTGSVTFYVVRRIAGKSAASWFKLGRYPYHMTLAEARAQTRVIVSQITEGKDPRQIATAQKREAEKAAREASAKTFGGVAEKYIDHIEGLTEDGKLRTGKIIVDRVRREFTAWWDWPMAELTYRDIRDFIKGIVERGRVGGRPEDRWPTCCKAYAAGVTTAH